MPIVINNHSFPTYVSLKRQFPGSPSKPLPEAGSEMSFAISQIVMLERGVALLSGERPRRCAFVS